MKRMLTVIIMAAGLFTSSNALFFGLFNSKRTAEPDLVISETKDTETDKTAYENYVRAIERSHYPLYSQLRYVPFYVYQPRYSEYVQPHFTKLIYHQPYSAVRNTQYETASVPIEEQTNPSSYLQQPINVLPVESIQQSFENIQQAQRDVDNLNTTPNTLVSSSKSHEYAVPEPQMAKTLYDLPISGIAPDFRTGGYAMKAVTANPMEANNNIGPKFGHAYETVDGTKVSEEGQLVRQANGEDTVVKRGQYEYIDATGETVRVKWIADENGFRLDN